MSGGQHMITIMKARYFAPLLFLFSSVSSSVSLAQEAHEMGAFVIKLGDETVGVEKYYRIGNRVFGEDMLLRENTERRFMDIRLEDDGFIDKQEEFHYKLSDDGKWEFSQHRIWKRKQDSTEMIEIKATSDAASPTTTRTETKEGYYSYTPRNIPFFPAFHVLATWMQSNDKEVVEGAMSWGQPR